MWWPVYRRLRGGRFISFYALAFIGFYEVAVLSASMSWPVIGFYELAFIGFYAVACARLL